MPIITIKKNNILHKYRACEMPACVMLAVKELN